MNPFVILFQPSPSLRLTGRQGPHPLTDADKARRQAAITLWAREQNAVNLRQGYG